MSEKPPSDRWFFCGLGVKEAHRRSLGLYERGAPAAASFDGLEQLEG
jgi:hypothetical protein